MVDPDGSKDHCGSCIEKMLASHFHEPVNLGNPSEVTVLEFAHEIIKLCGSKSTIEYRPLPQDDPRVRKPDITRARQLLGWEPRIARRDGLARTLEYFQGRLQADSAHGRQETS